MGELDRSKSFFPVNGHPVACFEQDGKCFDSQGQELTPEQLQATEQALAGLLVTDGIRDADRKSMSEKDEVIGRLRDQVTIMAADIRVKEVLIAELEAKRDTGNILLASEGQALEDEYQRAEAAVAQVAELQAKLIEVEEKLAAALIQINDAGFGVAAPADGKGKK